MNKETPVVQISAFYLEAGKHASTDNIHLDLIDYPTGENILENIKKVVEWLDTNGEDAGLLIRSGFDTGRHDFGKMFQTVIDLAEEGVSVFSLGGGGTARPIAVANGLGIVDHWEDVPGWIVLRLVFGPLKRLVTEALREGGYVKAEDIFNALSPAKFAFDDALGKPGAERKIHAVVPFRNAAGRIEACAASILRQQYGNYRAVLLDDCSGDGGFPKVLGDAKIRTAVNKERKFALKNIVDGLLSGGFDAEDIVCLVDGDDLLAHPHVFNVLNAVYSNPDVLVSYGSFRLFGSPRAIGAEYSEVEFADIRRAPWKATHLKAFRYSLFEKYMALDPDLACLKNSENEILKMPYDMALMFPLLEIAGKRHSRFIGTPLYLYRTHADNDHQANREEQAEGERHVRSMAGIAHKVFRTVR